MNRSISDRWLTPYTALARKKPRGSVRDYTANYDRPVISYPDWNQMRRHHEVATCPNVIGYYGISTSAA